MAHSIHDNHAFREMARAYENREPPEPKDYPAPLSHRYTIVRDAVETKFFTLTTLAGESFRIYSPELARRIDDIEAERFERPQTEDGEG